MSHFGEKSLALRRQDKIVFVFGSGLDLRDDFIVRLCDSHLKSASNDRLDKVTGRFPLPCREKVKGQASRE